MIILSIGLNIFEAKKIFKGKILDWDYDLLP